MNLEELRTAYTNLVNDPTFDKLELKLNQPNIFEIIGVVNKEIRHSNFIGWLCDPNKPHGLQEIFLKRFLREIFASSMLCNYDALFAEELKYDEVKIRREWRNIDLLILLPHNDPNKSTLLCIENKIWSKEHSNQLARYKEIIQSHYSRTFPHQFFIYLTPYGEKPKDQISEYVPLSYAFIIDILTRIIEVYQKQLNTHSQILIGDYLKTLKKFMMKESEEIVFAQKIYKQHQELLDFIIENKPDPQQELQNYIIQFLEQKGFYIGSKNKGFVRFLPEQITNIVPVYEDNYKGWSRKESFLFEFMVWEGQEFGIRFQAVVAPGKTDLRDLYHKIFKTKTLITNRNWQVYSLVDEQVDWNLFNLEGIDGIKENFEALFSKVEPIIIEFSEEIEKNKDSFKKIKS